MPRNPYVSWSTLRVVTAVDTLLTDYRPDEVTGTVKAKMTRVHPWTAILIQPLVLGADLNTFVLTISGWMDHSKQSKGNNPGPGLKLWAGTVTAGGRVWGTPDTPAEEQGQEWGANALWRIVDLFDATPLADLAGVVPRVQANVDGVLLLPTLGYTYILPEISSFSGVTKVGLLWRPINAGDSLVKTHEFA